MVASMFCMVAFIGFVGVAAVSEFIYHFFVW